MGSEQLLIKGALKAIPEGELAVAESFLAGVVRDLDASAVKNLLKHQLHEYDDPFKGAAADILEVGDNKVLPSLTLESTAKPGPIWNEEMLFRQSTQRELGENLRYGWLTDQEQRIYSNNLRWFEDAGFTEERFTYKTISKPFDTEQVLPKQVITRLENAGQSGEQLPNPLATHFYRGSSGRIQQFDVFDVQGASQLLNYSPNTIRSLANRNAIPGHKIDGPHGEEWRVLLPTVRNSTPSSLSTASQETEETLFRKLADGDPYDDPFRYVFQKP